MRVLISRITNRLTRFASVLATVLAGMAFVLVSSAAAGDKDDKKDEKKEIVKIIKIVKDDGSKSSSDRFDQARFDQFNNRVFFNPFFKPFFNPFINPFFDFDNFD